MKAYNYTTELTYEEYMCISHDAYHEKIRYYESRLGEILKMPFELRTEIRLDYTFALYKVGAYGQFLHKVDSLIRLVIRENIYEFRGKDVYRELLFRKAMSHYRRQELSRAKKVFAALVKMDFSTDCYKNEYYKCLRDEKRSKSQKARALSILIFLTLGVTIAIDLLLIRSFYTQHINTLNALKTFLLTAGVGLILWNEISSRAYARNMLNKLKQ